MNVLGRSETSVLFIIMVSAVFFLNFDSNLNDSCILDLLPVNEKSAAETKEFLNQVISICLDFIVKSNDRKEKVLDFHQPNELWNLYDFKIPSDPMNIDQLIKDCSECLKYQVKTGESLKFASLPSFRMNLPLTRESNNIPPFFDEIRERDAFKFVTQA